MLPWLTLSGQLAPDKHAKILNILEIEGFQSALDTLTLLLSLESVRVIKTNRLNYPDTGSTNRLNEY